MSRFGTFALLAATAALAPTLAACEGSPAETRACTAPGRPTSAGAGGAVLLGRVLFSVPVGARPGQALQQGRAADGRSFSKFGLYVFGDAPVSVEPLGDVDVAGWAQSGATSAITHQVAFQTKPPAPCEKQEWRVYPGGLVYASPQCATVRVTADGQTKDIRFGLAVDCAA